MEARSQATSALDARRAIFSALTYRNYRLYWLGQLGSVLAQHMEIVAQGWLVLQLTDSPLMLGLTGLTHAIPSILLTLLGGVIADRADRRRVMIVAQAAFTGLLLLLAVLVTTEKILVWHVMVIAFLTGCLKAFDRPSRYALLPQMVPPREIANAIALGSSVWQLNRLLGPSLAGMLVYLYGVGVAYYACFFASSSAVFLWLRIRIDQPRAEETGIGLLGGMLEGLHFIIRHDLFYTLIGLTFFNSVFGMSYVILMPVFARDILDVGSQGFGFLQSTSGFGALAGTLVVACLAASRSKGWHAMIGAITFGLFIIAFAFSRSYPLSLLLVFLVGLSNQLYMTTINTILQLNLPDQLRGRVMGIYGLTWDLMPVGGTVSGTIAEFAGAPVAVAIGGFLVAATALWVAAFLPIMRRIA